MDKVAAFSMSERSQLFEEAGRKKSVHPAVIEKDFWVCWTLKKLFGANTLSENLVFKGGTSLSKVHRLIDRFSEDIDLVLNWELLGYGKDKLDPWERQPSNTKQNKFNAKFNERAASYIQGTLCPLIKQLVASCAGISTIISSADPQVIEIHYPAAFDLDALRPEVKLEIGPLASWVPSDHFIIQPYAAEEFGHLFEDPDCPVVAIKAERTFWEKATILHQQAHRTTVMPPAYSRHYYDLYRLAQSHMKPVALTDLKMLADVVTFKQRFYPCPWAQYQDAKPGTIRLMPTGASRKELEVDYRKMRAMIFHSPPQWEHILEGLQALEVEINEGIAESKG